MAIDKAVDSAALEANLTTIANAIREKAGTSDALAFPVGFADAIAGIETGGGFNSDHADIAYGSFIPAESVEGVIVDCGFPISKDDAFMYSFAGIPIATRTESTNIAGYFANKMPSAALSDAAYGGTHYASSTATRLSSNTNVSLNNVFLDTTGNDIKLRGYGAFSFTTSYEYFWIVVKEKNV